MNKGMTDKMNLYMKAKEAYYAGNPIMEDFEFDELEKELGLENKSYVGTKHNAAYTIKHPFIMGSLSKVQIHKDNEGNINWTEYVDKVKKFVGNHNLIVTPKYDGCSFEGVVGNNGIETISSRGDGEYGKDLKQHLINHLNNALGSEKIFNHTNKKRVYRGEVLFDKDVFNNKYSEFVNPRSFVSGILNRDYDENDKEFINMVNDLSIIIYDVREIDDSNCIDLDWFDESIHLNKKNIPNFYIPVQFTNDDDAFGLEFLYNKFALYRNNCKYALDGIVFKPVKGERINNTEDVRPKDCVAVKFIPMLQETEIVDIEWNLGKTGELTPVIITKPVIMDGKTITRASAHNWGYCIANGINIGTKLILSLAGDIIPFIYKITKPSDNLELLNTTGYSNDKLEIHDCHLMVVMSDDERAKIDFLASAVVLNVDNFGPAIAETVFNSFDTCKSEIDDFFGITEVKKLPNNLLLVSPEEVYSAIVNSVVSKSSTKANKIMKAFKDMVSTISLAKIIQSCNFRFCGETVSEQCANYLMGIPYDFSHFAGEGYEWCLDKNNCGEDGPTENLSKVLNIITHLGKTFDDFKPREEELIKEDTRIPIIMTGEPNDYKTKDEFLRCHPEYRNTGSWKEVKILFTNSLDSNTSKMKKAREKNIEIRIY